MRSDVTRPQQWGGGWRPPWPPSVVVSDVDGTLITPERLVPHGTREGLAALREAGVAVVLCTGRMVHTARVMARRLGLTSGLMICYQGAVVADIAGGPWLYHRPIAHEDAIDVVRHVRSLGRHLNAHVDDRFCVEEMDRWTEMYAAYAEVAVDFVPDLEALVREREPTKFTVMTEPDDALALLPGLQARWRDRLYVTQSLPHVVEVTTAGATKAATLDWLLNDLRLDAGRAVACGDGRNDIDMLRWAGFAVAVAEASGPVREAADLVVPRDELGALFIRLAGTSRT